MLNQDFREFVQSLNDSGVPVNFIDIENLKKSKKAAGRLQDLADLEKLQ